MNLQTGLAVGILVIGSMSFSGNAQGSPSPQTAEYQYVTIDGAHVAYRLDGQGPGLVLIPGTGGNADNSWGLFIDALTPHWTVVRPEYSGAGKTTDDGSPLTMPKLAAQVIAAADAAGLDSFDVVGYSLGGSIAAFIAAEYPEKVRSVVLVSPPAFSDNRMRLLMRLWERLIQQNDFESMAGLVLLNGVSPDFLNGMSEDDIKELLSIIAHTNDWQGMLRQIDLDLRIDIREQLPRIKQPVLVIGCRHDQIVPSTHAREVARCIPNAEYTELDSGHLVILEQPQALAQQFVAFLKKQHRNNESTSEGS